MDLLTTIFVVEEKGRKWNYFGACHFIISACQNIISMPFTVLHTTLNRKV